MSTATLRTCSSPMAARSIRRPSSRAADRSTPTTASWSWRAQQARRMIDLFPPDRYDAIITNAGGCGSHLRHYGTCWSRSRVTRARARVGTRKVKDVQEWLVADRLPRASGRAIRRADDGDVPRLVPSGPWPEVSGQPRALLRLLPGISLVELAESTWCCGSAGVYALTQPAQADALLQRKVGHLRATDAAVVATANPGMSSSDCSRAARCW